MSNQDLKVEMICQVGFIVRDIDRAAQKFSEIFGFPKPPIIVTPGFERAKTKYDGQPSDATAKLAFFNTGQLQIELIEPDEKPSVWRDFLDQHGEGVHHIAFQVKDTEKVVQHLAGYDVDVVQQGLYSDGSGMYTYLDSSLQLGVSIELLQSFNEKG